MATTCYSGCNERTKMNLKEFLKESEGIREDTLSEAAASKSRVKRMEKLSDKIVKDMYKLIELFSKEHVVSSGDATLYKTKKDWEQLEGRSVVNKKTKGIV